MYYTFLIKYTFFSCLNYLCFIFLQRLQAALDSVVSENAELLDKVRQLHQQLANERSLLCQTTADKIDVEHKLHVSMFLIFHSDIDYCKYVSKVFRQLEISDKSPTM